MTSIFISYSSKDEKIAENLHYYLEHDGFEVWRDKRNIEADWSNEIADALTKQDIVLLIWTKNASESDYVKSEWMTARALGKVIKPILFSKDFPSLQLPKPLENVQAIADLGRVDDVEKNIQKLISPLESLNKEATRFTFKYDYNIIPAKHQIPFLPNPDFVGRADDLVNLYLEVIGGLNKLNYAHVGIVGIGGVGKTQLAVEFTYRYAFQFEKGTFWIQGTDPTTLVSQFVNIAQNELGLKIPNPDANSIDRDKQHLVEFRKYCGKNGSGMLLVIDNIIDPLDLYKDDILFPGDLAAKFNVLTLGCNVLFTTRRDFKNKLPNTIQHELKTLLLIDAYELLVRYRKPDTNKEEGFAKKICNSIGNLPLAIVLIGGYLRKYSDMSIEEYYNEHIKSRLDSIDLDEISQDELATRHDAAIRATFEPEWKILKEDKGKPVETERNQNAKKLVSILSLLSESVIVPKNRLIVYSGIEKYGKTKLIRPTESAFIFLDQINLVDILENGKSVRIHPLLREYVLEKLEQEGSENCQTKLKAESILNLKRTYYDNFPSLVQEYVERNNDIDSIREDFGITLSWLKELASLSVATNSTKISESDMNPIYELNKILGQEHKNLRLSVRNDSLTFNQDIRNLFAQSVLIRSYDLGHIEIAKKSRELLMQLKKPFFDIKLAVVRSKEALIMTLEGHSSSVMSVAISSDNTKIVSGSQDDTIMMWDLNTGKLLNTLEGHTSKDDDFKSIAITTDNTKIVGSLASIWGGKTIMIWDMNTGKLLNTLEGPLLLVVAITTDNNKIVGSGQNSIRVWDVNTGKLLNTLKGHSENISCIAITSDNTKIVSGSYETIKVWEVNTGKLLNTLEGRSDCIAITSDNTKIVSGSWDNTIKMWDLDGGMCYLSYRFDESISSIVISKSTNLIALGGFGGNLYAGTLQV